MAKFLILPPMVEINCGPITCTSATTYFCAHYETDGHVAECRLFKKKLKDCRNGSSYRCHDCLAAERAAEGKEKQ